MSNRNNKSSRNHKPHKPHQSNGYNRSNRPSKANEPSRTNRSSQSNKRHNTRRKSKPGRVPAPPKRRIKFVFRDDRRYRISIHTLFTIFLIFLGGLCTAFSYAFISDTKAKITQANTALAQQKEDNAILRTEMTQRFTRDEIAHIAEERLGMGRPDASQVIPIEVPRQSYVVLNDEEEEEDLSFWQGLLSFFAGFFNEKSD